MKITVNGEEKTFEAPLTLYDVLAQEEFTVRVRLGPGDMQQTVWTTDLSYDYVRINAEYRT